MTSSFSLNCLRMARISASRSRIRCCSRLARLTHLHPGSFHPAAQCVNADAQILGYFLGLPSLLCYHLYCTGLECLIVPRRWRTFFLCVCFHCFAPFLSILRLSFLSVNSGMGAIWIAWMKNFLNSQSSKDLRPRRSESVALPVKLTRTVVVSITEKRAGLDT